MSRTVRGPRCPGCSSLWISPCGERLWTCLVCGSIFLHREVGPGQRLLPDFGGEFVAAPVRPYRTGFDP